MFDSLLQDFRFALRMLAKKPGMTLTVVLTVALGIGANTAIFSVVQAIFLRPLPYQSTERLVYLSSSFPGNKSGGDNFSYLDFIEIERRARSFDLVAAYQDWNPVALTDAGEPVRVSTNFVSDRYLELFSAKPSAGRLFTPEETRVPGTAPVALVGHSFWQRQFGGDPNIVGRTVRLNQTPVTVVGVMSADFRDLEETSRPTIDLWLPVGLTTTLLQQQILDNRNQRVFWGVGRLKDGVTLQQGQAELDAIAGQLAREFPQSNTGFGLKIDSLRDHFFAVFYKPILVLVVGSGFVLLIGCTNVANLMLVSHRERRRELAVKTAVGASRTRLVRQLLTESLLTASLGGAAGLAAAYWAVEALRKWDALSLPAFASVAIDLRVFLASSLLTLGTGVLFGIIPAFLGARTDVREVLNRSSIQAGGRGGRSWKLLVTAEVALSLVLLVGAGLTFKSFQKLTRTDLGFPTDNLLTLRMDLRSTRYAERPPRIQFVKSLLEKTEALPGVKSVSVWGPADLGHATWVAFVAPEGQAVTTESDWLAVNRHSVNPGALDRLGIRMLQGRDLSWDDTADKPQAVVVSESLARRYWPGENPVGKRLLRQTQAQPQAMTVVGVAADARHRQRYHFQAGAMAFQPHYDVYFPYSQNPNQALVLAVRLDGGGDLSAALRQTVASIDPNLPLYDLKMLDDRLREQEGPTRAVALLMGLYAALSLLLAAVGVYGVLSHAAGARTREFGIRLALGARKYHVFGLVLGQGMGLALLGTGIGLCASWFLTRLLEGLLFGVSPNDPVVFGVISVVLLGTAAAACWIPARRAMRIEPIRALRIE